MGSLGLDLWSGLNNIDSTNFAPGPSGQGATWYDTLWNIGIDIYDRVTGQPGYSSNPPYPGWIYNTQTGQYQAPAQSGINMNTLLPWLVVGGMLLFAVTKKKR